MEKIPFDPDPNVISAIAKKAFDIVSSQGTLFPAGSHQTQIDPEVIAQAIMKSLTSMESLEPTETTSSETPSFENINAIVKETAKNISEFYGAPSTSLSEDLVTTPESPDPVHKEGDVSRNVAPLERPEGTTRQSIASTSKTVNQGNQLTPDFVSTLASEASKSLSGITEANVPQYPTSLKEAEFNPSVETARSTWDVAPKASPTGLSEITAQSVQATAKETSDRAETQDLESPPVGVRQTDNLDQFGQSTLSSQEMSAGYFKQISSGFPLDIPIPKESEVPEQTSLLDEEEHPILAGMMRDVTSEVQPSEPTTDAEQLSQPSTMSETSMSSRAKLPEVESGTKVVDVDQVSTQANVPDTSLGSQAMTPEPERATAPMGRTAIESTQALPDSDIQQPVPSEMGYMPALDADPIDVNRYFKELSSGFSIDVPVQIGPDQQVEPDEGISDEVKSGEQFKGVFYDVHLFRKDFPILHRKVHGKPLIWLDNSATSQKPNQVIDAVAQYYREYNSNIHRGAHALAAMATDAYEEARVKVQRFIGASLPEEIIFVRGTTEGINLVTQTYGRRHIEKGDEIILSMLEHHSNIVSWQMLAKEKGAKLKVAPVNSKGEIILEDYELLFTPRTRIVAMTHASNAIGTVPPLKQMIKIAHSHGVPVVVDGAQSVPHMPVNVVDLDADFYTFSGHKIFGPMGVGAVYGKKHLLEAMPPWQGGGSMIKHVDFEHTEFNKIPEKFEAGTPNVVGPIGLGVALDYLDKIGMENIERYEHELLVYATKLLKTVPGLCLIGSAREKIGVLSFIIEGIPPDEIGKELDAEGIAVRVGHHCAQPILKHFNLTSVVRASLAFYNTKQEIDKLVEILCRIQKQWSGKSFLI
ncbi:MAG: SufS family cysteine desulfurase [Candidatus Kariarchaeaceae archaeon]